MTNSSDDFPFPTNNFTQKSISTFMRVIPNDKSLSNDFISNIVSYIESKDLNFYEFCSKEKEIHNPFHGKSITKRNYLEKLLAHYISSFKTAQTTTFNKSLLLDYKLGVKKIFAFPNQNYTNRTRDITSAINTSIHELISDCTIDKFQKELNKIFKYLVDNRSFPFSTISNLHLIISRIDDFYNTKINQEQQKHFYVLINTLKLYLYWFNLDFISFLSYFVNLFLYGQINPELKPLISSQINNIPFSFIQKTACNNTIIILNLHFNSIFDFCFAKTNKDRKFLFLTKSGLFECNLQGQMKIDFSSMSPIDFSASENSELLNILNESSSEKVKITFSDDILYIFLIEKKIVHRFNLHKKVQDQDQDQEEDKESDKVSLENIQISISDDYPVISIGAYNNYIRIIQQKSVQCDKATFIFTNIDLAPNNRSESNEKEEKKTAQTVFEFEVKLSNDQNKSSIDALFSNEFIYIYYNDFVLDQLVILKDGSVQKESMIELPTFIQSHSKLKGSDDHYFIKLSKVAMNNDFGISITQFYLPYCSFQSSENVNLFIEYPILHFISRTIDKYNSILANLFILRQNEADLGSNDNQIFFKNYIINTRRLKELKDSILHLNNDELKSFFSSVLIKFINVYLCRDFFEYLTESNNHKELFSTIKNVICDLSNDFDLTICESILSIVSIFGKILFIPDSKKMLNDLIKKIYTKMVEEHKRIRCFYCYLYSGPLSSFILDRNTYEQMKKSKLSLHSIFYNSIQHFHIFNDSELEMKLPYIDALFDFLENCLKNEKNGLFTVERILPYLFYYDSSNLNFSLELEKRIIKLTTLIYPQIRKIPSVIKNDEDFSMMNMNLGKQDKILVESQVITIEPKTKQELYEVIFDPRVNYATLSLNKHSKFSIGDKIIVIKDNIKSTHLAAKLIDKKRKVCKYVPINSNQFQFKYSRFHNKTRDYHISVILNAYIKNETFSWTPNLHLYFYNYLLYFIFSLNSKIYMSTPIEKMEEEISFILNDEIVQGIKFEDIYQYEKELNQSNKSPKTMKRGISRGISYDSDGSNNYDTEVKKNFIKNLINAKKDSIYDIFLTFLYEKVKSNVNKLNQASENIIEIEHYFIACLLKQLGLISICMDTMNTFLLTKKNERHSIKIPNKILFVWQKTMELRKKIYFKGQKIRQSNEFTLYEEYLQEIKYKCVLFLYSDSILYLKFKNNWDKDKIESSAKSIYSFVTSEITVKNISELIDLRRKRLFLSNKSLTLITSFINSNLLLESSKPIFASYCTFNPLLYKLKGLTRIELEDYYRSFSNLSIKIIENIFNQLSFNMIINPSFLLQPLFDHDIDESKIKCSQLLIDLLNKSKEGDFLYKNQISFNLILILFAIASQTKSSNVIDQIISFLFDESTDFNSKYLILYYIPYYIKLIPENGKVLDENLVLSLLETNKSIPIIVNLLIEWLAYIFIATNENNSSERRSFILKILKGIGNAFVGKSCLFIDDSFQPFTHRQIAESMITFVLHLFNSKNEILTSIIHDILTNQIKNIDFNKQEEFDVVIIGLFASIGSEISALEKTRKVTLYKNKSYVNFYNIATLSTVYNKCLSRVYTNAVFIDPSLFDLNQVEIENLLDLNENILKSDYLYAKDYEYEINQEEIIKSIFIATFYSFLPIVMQNKNNAEILFKEEIIGRSLKLLILAREKIPSNENLILYLSHYLESAISNPLYNSTTENDNIVDSNGSFRFLKLNAGEIIYDKSDIIKSDPSTMNYFMCNRPFKMSRETYYEVKINKIGSKNIFIGFIDSEETNINNAFGFGSFNKKAVFCRRMQYLSTIITVSNDKIMEEKNVIAINEGDSIGCYYTPDFVYLTKNGQITPYRLFHKSLAAYLPIIIIDRDEIELEIIHNVSIVDHSNDKFHFLNANKVPNNFFKENDFEEIDQMPKTGISVSDTYSYYIGSYATINQNASDEYKNNYCIIKDIPKDDKLTVYAYNGMKLSKETTELKLDCIESEMNFFFNIIENINNTKFGYNSSFDLNNIPDHLQIDPDLNQIRKYMKNKTIKENSKSIAIIMTRYLSFILVDYLRYSKSYLLYEEEGVNSSEMHIINQYLALSLPTITSFEDSSNYVTNRDNFLIFDDDKDKLKLFIPGSYALFSFSFQAFLKRAENKVHPQFFIDLFENLFIASNTYKYNSSSSLYNLIRSNYKFESVYPLPAYYKVNTVITKTKAKNDDSNIFGFIPILVSDIPPALSCVKCIGNLYRITSDKASFYYNYKIAEKNFYFEWDLIKNTMFKEYRLKLGIFNLSKKLDINIIDGPLGFIQIVILLIKSLNLSNHLMKDCLNHKLLDMLYTLSTTNNNNENTDNNENNFIDPLVYPFVKQLILILQSVSNFPEVLLSKKCQDSFSILSYFPKSKYESDSLKMVKNQSYLIFNIYNILIKSMNAERQFQQNEIDLESLFETYYLINSQLFNIRITKSDNLNYLLYFSFILCHNKGNLPYPKFLFVHERIRQYFGGFQLYKKIEIKEEQSIKINDEHYIYKSEMIFNVFSLDFSFHITISPNYRAFIHQLTDNKTIEMENNSTKPFSVSFPLVILIQKTNSDEEMCNCEIVLTFNPSKEQQQDYFISHYKELQTEFKRFLSIETKYEVSDIPDNDLTMYKTLFMMPRIFDNLSDPIKSLKKSIFTNNIKLFTYVIYHFYESIYGLKTLNQMYIDTQKINLFIDPIFNSLKQIETKLKFQLIHHLFQVFRVKELGLPILTFDRFEAQYFKENIRGKHLPLFVQFMKQVSTCDLFKLRKMNQNPFKVILKNEQGIDASGPGRELFSNLIVEMMDDNLGIFTTNPNMRNEIPDSNKEDLIINKHMRPDIYQYENSKDFSNRLVYAGSLIAICILSNIPQQMNLATFIWEYLLNKTVSIESIYEIDNDFKNFIKNAENLLERINSNSIDDEELESSLIYSFEITNSFGSTVELVHSGSLKSVTKENLSVFIELAKSYRIHEFDNELSNLKIGFSHIINKRLFLNILKPSELKLLACGEKECDIERLKELTEVKDRNSTGGKERELMFWNVMNSLSVHERLMFIRFSSGYTGLPSPGMSWASKLKVIFLNEEQSRSYFNLPHSHTCFSIVEIPLFHSESELKNMILIVIMCQSYGNS